MAQEDKALHLSIKVIPRAGITGVRGRMSDGTVRISLRAPPADGRANDELIRFLASEFGTSRSSVKLLSGATSRRKLVLVESFNRVPDWLKE